MEIRGFGLAFRFPAEKTEDESWNLLFRALPYKDLTGCGLYCCLPREEEVMPQDNRFCVIDNLSRSRARRIFEVYQRSAALQCAMTAYRPVMQSNYLMHCEQTGHLGTVCEDGSVSGGDVSFGCMRFQNRELPPIVDLIPARMLIVGAKCGDASAMDVCRTVARAVCNDIPLATPLMLPAANGASGLVDAVVRGLCGRYRRVMLSNGKESYIGVLPDYSAVVDESYQGTDAAVSGILGEKTAAALTAGCRKVAVSAGEHFEVDGGEGFIKALMHAYPAGIPEDASITFLHPDMPEQRNYPQLFDSVCTLHAHTLSWIDRMLNIDQRIADASHVIWAVAPVGKSDAVERARVEKTAKQLLRRFVEVEFSEGEPLEAAVSKRILRLSENIWK